jgi:hypothetical protein
VLRAVLRAVLAAERMPAMQMPAPVVQVRAPVVQRRAPSRPVVDGPALDPRRQQPLA